MHLTELFPASTQSVIHNMINTQITVGDGFKASFLKESLHPIPLCSSFVLVSNVVKRFRDQKMQIEELSQLVVLLPIGEHSKTMRIIPSDPKNMRIVNK